MDIVLVNPEIPQNTGNIARTCALTGVRLHLVEPLGFSISDKYLKRAGLDYWDKVEVHIWNSFQAVVECHPEARIYLATTKADNRYDEVSYASNSMLVFGPESRGLDDEIRGLYPLNHIRIPMLNIGRSLNLSNSAAIILYEALRQQNFPNLK